MPRSYFLSCASCSFLFCPSTRLTVRKRTVNLAQSDTRRVYAGHARSQKVEGGSPSSLCQIIRQQQSFGCEVVRTLHISGLFCGLGLFHVFANLTYAVLLA